MGSNPTSECWTQSLHHSFKAFIWYFIWNSKLTYRWIVKYKFLHFSRQEICGSQVWALPQGSDVAGSIQPDLCDMHGGVVWVKGAPKGGGYQYGLPLELPAQCPAVVMLLTRLEKKKKMNCIKCSCSPSLPHLLRLPSFAFLKVHPSKRNDGNYTFSTQQPHYQFNHLSMSRLSIHYGKFPRTLHSQAHPLLCKDINAQRPLVSNSIPGGPQLKTPDPANQAKLCRAGALQELSLRPMHIHVIKHLYPTNTQSHIISITCSWADVHHYG